MDRTAKIVQTQEYLLRLGIDSEDLRLQGKAAFCSEKDAKLSFRKSADAQENLQRTLAWGIFRYMEDGHLAALLKHDLPNKEEELFARIVMLLDCPQGQAQSIALAQLRADYRETGFRPKPLELPRRNTEK